MKKLLRRIRVAWRYGIDALRGEPIRGWRKTEEGQYLCDGDCGRWSMHGVCTCGLTHYFKYHGKSDKVARPPSSWRREYATEEAMYIVPWERLCSHGLDLDGPTCPDCHAEWLRAEEQLQEWLSNRPKRSPNDEAQPEEQERP